MDEVADVGGQTPYEVVAARNSQAALRERHPRT